MAAKKTTTTVKKTVAKSQATAKKAAPAKAATTPATKRGKAKTVKTVDYRLLDIQNTIAVIADKVERERVEVFCVDVVRQAHLLAHARTEAGIAYRKYLSEVASAARTVAVASISGDEEQIADAAVQLSDEVDNSPFSSVIHEQFDYAAAPDSFYIARQVVKEQQVELAFALRGID